MKLITTAAARLWKNRKSSATFVALAIGFSIPAQADPIYIDDTVPFAEAFTFAASPGNNVEVSTVSPLGFSCSSCASYGNPLGPFSGSATFGQTDFVAGPLETNTPIAGDSTFPVSPPGSPPETFTYDSGTNSDSLVANINWTAVVQIAPGEVQFSGTGMVTGVTVDPTDTSSFGTEWQPFETLSAVFDSQIPPLCDLATLVTTGCPGAGIGYPPVTVEVGLFEAADAMPGPPLLPPVPPLIQTPEPMSSFVALGIALCCAWGMYPLMRRERSRS